MNAELLRTPLMLSAEAGMAGKPGGAALWITNIAVDQPVAAIPFLMLFVCLSEGRSRKNKHVLGEQALDTWQFSLVLQGVQGVSMARYLNDTCGMVWQEQMMHKQV